MLLCSTPLFAHMEWSVSFASLEPSRISVLEYPYICTFQTRQNLIGAAKNVGEASQEVMYNVGETADDMDKMYQETLLALAKAVANATATLVLKAKNVASTTDDQGLQNKVISSATSCALATSQLVACTKVSYSYCICRPRVILSQCSVCRTKIYILPGVTIFRHIMP